MVRMGRIDALLDDALFVAARHARGCLQHPGALAGVLRIIRTCS